MMIDQWIYGTLFSDKPIWYDSTQGKIIKKMPNRAATTLASKVLGRLRKILGASHAHHSNIPIRRNHSDLWHVSTHHRQVFGNPPACWIQREIGIAPGIFVPVPQVPHDISPCAAQETPTALQLVNP